MAETQADTESQKKLDMILGHLDSVNKRLDAAETERKADRQRVDAACERMDSMDKVRKDAAEKEEEEKKKADAARKDAENEEERKKADAARKDAEREEEEKKAKADAARADSNADLRTRLDEISRRLPVEIPEAERAQFVDAQVQAERVAQAFMDSAPRWTNGESFPDYVRRLAGKYKQHSATWKDTDLSKVDANILGVISKQIYADALQAAAAPSSVPVGMLREVVENDRTGRRISKFIGDPEATWGPFKQPLRGVIGMRPPATH